jgi:glucose/arabinose dehydrogenase
MKKNIVIASVMVVFLLLFVGLFVFQDELRKVFFNSRNSGISSGAFVSVNPGNQKSPFSVQAKDIQTVVQNLTIPWEIVFLPDGDMLVTERPGALLRIGQETQTIQEIEGVEHIGEGGLLGLALHPNFAENGFLYFYLTAQTENGLINRVERYKFNMDANSLSEKEIILDGINGASYHDGGRIKFGPDGLLYITTGDAGNENLAQDINSLNGKILRITAEGDVPEDNPFANEVWTYGHRNPQGLTWDDQGKLWVTEHGPSGLQSGWDEINLVKAGQNYGWPVIKGGKQNEGMISPVIQSGADDTWAPAGILFLKGSLFFAGLRGSALYQANVEDSQITNLIANFKNEFGRLRAVVLGPDGFIYITTSNLDGRGEVRPGDDKIIKINPEIFN